MIHHISIPAANPFHVAQTLAEILGGDVTRFGPYDHSYIAWAGDTHGTAIEIFPAGTEMLPDQGFGEANFRHNATTSGFTATHAAVSVPCTREKIFSVAEREDWRAIELSRGSFRVIEFWIENHARAVDRGHGRRISPFHALRPDVCRVTNCTATNNNLFTA